MLMAGIFPVMALAATLPPVKKKKTVIPAKQAIVFFDDFSGKSVDRSKWNIEVSHGVPNNEQEAYVDSSATIYIAHGAESDGAQNGALVIKPVYSAGYQTVGDKTFDFISGRMNTRSKVQFTYGTVAARMKMPAGDGFWPAFWMLGEGKWPDCGEIDIMENVGEPDWISAALHGPGYFGETPLVNKWFFNLGIDVTQWHVYSVDWSKDALLFKVDGRLFYRVTRPMVENYGRWAFDNPKFLIVNFALGGAYPAKISGVKTPYNGMPQAEVDAIKAGKAKVLVDWVKVTQ
jgi:beta-glucanase (GH16 family)